MPEHADPSNASSTAFACPRSRSITVRPSPECWRSPAPCSRRNGGRSQPSRSPGPPPTWTRSEWLPSCATPHSRSHGDWPLEWPDVHAAPGTDAIGVLDRITAIFEAFEDDDPGLAISTLAARTGLAKSTVSRLVADLVRQGYLERDGRLVRLGLRLFELGQLAERPQQLRSAASSVMADLRAATGASIHLALRDGDDSTYVAILRGRMPAPPFARTGGR